MSKTNHIEKLFIRTDDCHYLIKLEKEQAVYYEQKPGNDYEPAPFVAGEVAHALNLAMLQCLIPDIEETHGDDVSELAQCAAKGTHFMIDIETLGTRPGDIVFEISCVRFDPITGRDHESWNQCLSIEFQQSHGMTVDLETLGWWIRENGRNPMEENEAHETYTPAQLKDFNKWLKKIEPKKNDRRFWCRGANFDPVLLEPLFEKMSVPVPWKYWQWRDVRTLQGILEAHGVTVEKPVNTAHSAYMDCIAQIAQVRDLLKLISGLEVR